MEMFMISWLEFIITGLCCIAIGAILCYAIMCKDEELEEAEDEPEKEPEEVPKSEQRLLHYIDVERADVVNLQVNFSMTAEAASNFRTEEDRERYMRLKIANAMSDRIITFIEVKSEFDPMSNTYKYRGRIRVLERRN